MPTSTSVRNVNPDYRLGLCIRAQSNMNSGKKRVPEPFAPKGSDRWRVTRKVHDGQKVAEFLRGESMRSHSKLGLDSLIYYVRRYNAARNKYVRSDFPGPRELGGWR
jgi:hypothetical protein